MIKILLTTIILIYIYSPVEAQIKSEIQNKTILIVNSVPGEGIETKLYIYGDGNGEISELSTGRWVIRSKFVVGQQKLIELINLIERTNFNELKNHKFTETCPEAYDGVRYVYSFATKHGVEILDSCETLIDEKSQLFRVIKNISDNSYSEAFRSA